MVTLLLLAACWRPCAPTAADADGDGVIRWMACGDAPTEPVETCATTRWHLDADLDGFGDPDAAVESCAAPDGYVADGTDCDDADPAVSPAAEEVCDGLDQDCDGEVDDRAPDGETAWYADIDGDGFGGAVPTYDCVPPDGYVAVGGDCDPDDPAVHPGATEIPYDGIDQDCESSTRDTDADRDGYAIGSLDCDDTDPAIHRGATETCGDAVDNNCDGLVDVACAPLSTATARVEGTASADYVGLHVAPAGDTDGDGLGDVWVSSRHVGTGALLLLRGAPGGTIAPGAADAVLVGGYTGEGFGEAAAATGDVDGDGLDDVIVGAAYNEDGGADAGVARLLRGPFSGTVESADVGIRLFGADGDRAGHDVAAGSDVDGDGAPDVAVGVLGAVYVHATPSADADLAATGARLVGFAAGGIGVELVGDLDGDGIGEVAVTLSQGTSDSPGDSFLYVFGGPVLGARTAAEADLTLTATDTMEPGFSVSGRGDADGDGRADLLVGLVTTSAARIDLYTDPFGAGLGAPDASIVATASGWWSRAAWAGDIDADGRDDALLVLPSDTMDGGRGTASLFTAPLSGTLGPGDAYASFASDDSASYPAMVGASAGDVDGDGGDDVVIGAAYANAGDVEYAGAAYILTGLDR